MDKFWRFWRVPRAGANLVNVKRKIFVALLAGLLAVAPARADDLVTLSGTTYRHVVPVRVEPDGVTWQHEDGMVKVDFADSPESVRRQYHYDAATAAAYRDAHTQKRQEAEAQVKQDAAERETHRRERLAAAAAQTATGTDAATVFRRALSPAASQATRDAATQMRADADRRAAEAADPLKFIPALPGLFGPRPINPFMDTPNAQEYIASLHRSPTGASGNFVPMAVDANRSTVLDNPLYLTRSYYEDVDRAAAFARGVPQTPP